MVYLPSGREFLQAAVTYSSNKFSDGFQRNSITKVQNQDFMLPMNKIHTGEMNVKPPKRIKQSRLNLSWIQIYTIEIDGFFNTTKGEKFKLESDGINTHLHLEKGGESLPQGVWAPNQMLDQTLTSPTWIPPKNGFPERILVKTKLQWQEVEGSMVDSQGFWLLSVGDESGEEGKNFEREGKGENAGSLRGRGRN